MSDAISAFFKEVGKTPLLTREEEVLLSQRIEQGDQAARKQMINANLRLAISIAKKYQNKGCPLEDLIQESSIGLMKAVDRFDWRRGFKFSTYACWWIKQAVRRHVASHSASIRLPSHAKGLLWKAKKMSDEYEEEFGVAPSTAELAELLGVTEDSLKSIRAAAVTPISIDAKIRYRGGSEGRTIGEMIPDDRDWDMGKDLDKEKIATLVRSAMGTLTEREEKIIRLRFGISEDVTASEKFPISQKEINRLKKLSKKQGA